MFYMACPAWYMDGCRLPEEGNAVFGFVMEKTRCLGGESAAAPGGLKGRNAMAHILVVDDDADMRALLSLSLIHIFSMRSISCSPILERTAAIFPLTCCPR